MKESSESSIIVSEGPTTEDPGRPGGQIQLRHPPHPRRCQDPKDQNRPSFLPKRNRCGSDDKGTGIQTHTDHLYRLLISLDLTSTYD